MSTATNDFPSDVLLENGKVKSDADGGFVLRRRNGISQPSLFLFHYPLDVGFLSRERHLAEERYVSPHDAFRIGGGDRASRRTKDGDLRGGEGTKIK